MRRNFIVVTAVLMFCAAVSMSAQAPDFSGKWVADAAAAPPAGAPAGGGGGGGGRGGGRGGGFGNEFTIAQNAKTLTITRMQGDATVTTVFNLDGSESKNMVAGRGGGEPTAQVSKAVWEGAKLVVTTTAPNGEQKRVFAMEGGNLTIETTQPGRDGGPGTPAKLTYKKG